VIHDQDGKILRIGALDAEMAEDDVGLRRRAIDAKSFAPEAV
jgi:hypothetical protein